MVCYHDFAIGPPQFWPLLSNATYISGPLMTMVKCTDRYVKRQCDTDRVNIGRSKCSQRQLPAKMADICRDWLTDQPQNAALL